MVDLCYLCGNPATRSLELKDTFTSHSACKVPNSNKMCDRCHTSIAGEEKQLWYWNEGKNKWSKMWGRSLSRVYAKDKLIAPTIEGIHTEGNDTFPIVKNLLSRADIRNFLINPPCPPFTIAIAPHRGTRLLQLISFVGQIPIRN
jgi:hypothetical protein